MTPAAETIRNLDLPSGMRLSSLQRDGATFAAAIALHGGFRNDPEDTSGLRHLLEHLAFAGPRGEAAQALSRRGCHVNGWTSLEQTVLWISGPAALAREGVQFLLSALEEPAFTPADLAHEIEVIRQESASRTYTPWDYHRDCIIGAIAGEPGCWLGALTNIDGLAKLSHAQVREAAAKHLAPANACLVLVGPDTQQPLEGLLAGANPSPPPDNELEPEAEPPPLPTVYGGKIKHADQLAIYRCYHYRPAGVYRGVAVAALCDYLGGSTYGQLFQHLRIRAPLCYETGISALWLSDCGLITAYTVVDPKKAEPALHALNEITTRVRAGGLEAAAFEEFRARTRQNFERLDRDIEPLCGFIVERSTRTDRPPSGIATYLQRLEQATLEEVNHAVAQIMRPQRTLTALIGPFPRLRPFRTRRLMRLAEQG